MASSKSKVTSMAKVEQTTTPDYIVETNGQTAFVFSTPAVLAVDKRHKQVGKTATEINQRIAQQLIREPMLLLFALSHLTVMERRLYWHVLHQIKSLQNTVKSPAKEVSSLVVRIHYTDILNSDSNRSITDMKKIVDSISQKSVKWQSDEGVYTNIVMFPTARYVSNEGNFELIVNPPLIPAFLQLGNDYAEYLLADALKLTSEYAQLLFSILSRHVYRGKWGADLPTFREMMGATSKAYDSFSNIKKRIIESAIEQIHQYTPYRVTYLVIYESRQPVRIEFTIKDTSLDQQLANEANTQQLLTENLEYVASLGFYQRREFAERQISQNYRQHFTQNQIYSILSDEDYLNRFVRAETYARSGKVQTEKIVAYILKSVFNPSPNPIINPKDTAKST